jgi:hypothetical protein
VLRAGRLEAARDILIFYGIVHGEKRREYGNQYPGGAYEQAQPEHEVFLF